MILIIIIIIIIIIIVAVIITTLLLLLCLITVFLCFFFFSSFFSYSIATEMHKYLYPIIWGSNPTNFSLGLFPAEVREEYTIFAH